MNDVIKINRKFRSAIIVFSALIIIAITMIVLANRFIEDENIQYIIYFVVLLALLFIIIGYKNKFDQITNLSYIIKIRENSGDPLSMVHTKDLTNYREFIQKKGFILFAQDKEHTLFYRISEDQIKKIFSKHMLEVVIILDPQVKGFYLDQVNEEVSKIQHLKPNERLKLDRIFVTQIKPISDLSDQTKEEIKEIIFIKTTGTSLFLRSNTTIISTINIGLYRESMKAVLLYSDTYSPSLYYQYHINEIKSMV